MARTSRLGLRYGVLRDVVTTLGPSEERMPAAQHEEAVDSGKTVGDTDGADIGIRLGSLRCGITYASTGFVRRETVQSHGA